MTKKLTIIVYTLFIYIISATAAMSQFRMLSTVPATHAEAYRCIFFDSQGLLWIGTDGGLKRYDGYEMKTYRSNAYSPKLLPNNTVLCITEDKKGRLWLGTRNGLVCFDKRWNTFKTYNLPKDNQRIIYTLFTDREGRVWIGTDGGLSLYDEKNDSIINYFHDEITFLNPEGKITDRTPYSVKAIAEDSQGNIYIGTWTSGLMKLQPGTRSFIRYPKQNHLNSAYSLTFDSKGRLWIGTWGHGIERLDEPHNPRSQKVSRWSVPGLTNYYYRLQENPLDNTMMAVCREGVYSIDNNDLGHFYKLQDIAGNNTNLSNDMIVGKNGDIWISTVSDGILHLTTKPSPFKEYLLPTPEQSVQSIFTADGKTIWLGLTPTGVMKYDTEKGTVVNDSQIQGIQSTDKNFQKSTIYSITDDKQGNILMANGGHGVMQLNKNGSYNSYYAFHYDFISDNFVNTLFTSSDGTIWIGQRNYLSIRMPNGKGRKLEMKEGNDNFTTCDVRGIIEDRQHNIWVATDNEGIIKIKPGKQFTFHHYSLNNGRLPVEDVTICHEDTYGNIWAITNSGGLLKLEKKDDRFVPVNRKYGIDGEKVFSINNDNHGHIWITTERALVRLMFTDANANPIVTTFAKDGDENGYAFCTNSTFKYKNTLYFGGRSGFVAFDTNKVTEESKNNIANIVVTEIFVAGKKYDETDSVKRIRISEEAPLFTKKITIPANVERFALVFSLLTYNNVQQNKYAYKLDSENHWHYADVSQRRANFEGLAPGKYKLYVKAADSYGKWTELPYPIEIIILPPWYLSWWAILIYILFGLVCIRLLVLWYKEHLKTRNRLQMAVILTNITHELLTPLTIISSSIDEMKEEAPQFDNKYRVMKNNINRLTRLLRQMLEVRKQQAGQLKLKVAEDNLSEFVKMECENIMPMTTPKKVVLTTNIDPTLNKVYFDRDKLDKILYNLLSNAVKYNKEGGRVMVAVERAGENMRLTVEDEGIGISKANLKRLYTRFLDGDYRKINATGTGIGVSLTRDLVVLHHGTIDCQSRVGEGTRFTIELPINKEAYNENELVEKTIDEMAVENIQMTTQLPVAKDEEPQDNGSDKDYTILVVEDNEELLDLMSRLLRKKYNVLTANNGKQAWNIIQKQELDIVITDVMMPVMDGIELTQTIKQSTDYGQLPVVMLTAKTSDEDRNAAFGIGADEYIIKPFNIEDLKVRIDNIIANRQRIRERFSSQTDFEVDEQHYSNPDEVFLKRAIECVKANIGEYDRESFAQDMCLSSSSLYNKLRAITGQNITSFISSVRLKEACRIAKREPDIKVAELGMRVGFSTPKYFTKVFKDEFGFSPSEYLEKIRKENEQDK